MSQQNTTQTRSASTKDNKATTSPTNTTSTTTENKDVPRDSKRVYVRWDFSDDMLKAMFEKYGKVAEARVATLRGRAKSSFGFVTFENEDAAAKAVAELNQKTVTTTPVFNVEAAAAERRQRAPRDTTTKDTNNSGNNNSGNNNNSNNQSGNNSRRSGGRRRRGGRTGGRNSGNNNSGNNQSGNNNSGNNNGGRNNSGNNSGRNNNNSNNSNSSNNSGNQQRQQRQRDPNWGVHVHLNPDVIATSIPKDAKLTQLNAGTRFFRKRTDVKQIQQLALNADPSKGPFHCNFKLGSFGLKLLSVNVRCKNGTTRVTCKVQEQNTEKTRTRDVFLGFKSDGKISHRPFELREPNSEQKDGSQEVFFVTIDSITVDQNTGLWSQLMLSLVSLILPPRSQQTTTTTTNTTSQSSSQAQTK